MSESPHGNEFEGYDIPNSALEEPEVTEESMGMPPDEVRSFVPEAQPATESEVISADEHNLEIIKERLKTERSVRILRSLEGAALLIDQRIKNHESRRKPKSS